MIARALRFLGWALVALLLVMVGATGYFAATDSGLQRLLALGQRFAPGELRWDEAHGRLLGPLWLRNLSYRQPDGLAITLGHLALRWQPSALGTRTLRVEQLHLRDLDIQLPPPGPEPAAREPLRLPNLRLPLGVELQNIDIENVRIHPHGASSPVVVEQLRLNAAGEDATLKIVEFQLRAPTLEVNLNGTLQPIGDYPLELELDWQYAHPEFGPFAGNAAAKGDLAQLRLTHELQGAAHASLDAELFDLVRQPRWDARITVDSEDLGQFVPRLAGAPLRTELTSAGTIEAFSAQGTLATTLAETGPVRLDLELTGDTERIRLREIALRQADGPAEARVSGEIEIDGMRAELDGEWRALNWPMVGAEPLYRSPQGSVRFKGDARDFSAQVRTRLDGSMLGALDASLDATGTAGKLQLNPLTVRALDGPLQLSADGEFDPGARTFQARGNWQSLTWPLRGTPQFESSSGQFAGGGQFEDYRFELSASAQGPTLPKGDWNLSGRGSTEALQAFTLNGKLLEGTLRLEGNARWQPEIVWQVALSGQGLNPGAHWPELPGKLALQVQSAGTLTADGPALSAEIAELSGTFRGQPVRGQGDLDLRGTTLDLRDLRLTSGDARLEANGRLADTWDLRWNLSMPDLARLAPGLSGAIQGNGTLGGNPTQPRATLDLKVSDLAAGAARIKQLAGAAQIDLAGASRSNVDFKATSLTLAGQSWSDFSLNGGGTPGEHALTLKLGGEPGQLELALRGAVQDRQWQGQITELTAQKTEFGDWTLAQPAALRLASGAARVEPLCLASPPTRVCAEADWSGTDGAHGEVTLEGLEPKRFAAWLPAGIQLDTALAGKADGMLDPRGVLRANADFRLRPGRLEFETNGDPLRIALGASTLGARLDGDDANVVMAIDLGEMGRADANTRIGDLGGTPRVDGTLKVRLDDLAPLSALAPQLQSVTGRLDADLVLGGTLEVPSVGGEFELSELSAEVPAVAIRIENGRLLARSDGQGPLTIDGAATSGPGTLKLGGQFDPATRALELQLTGSEFQAANAKTVRARISPNLNLALDDQGMRVEGEVQVPQAYFNAKGGGGQKTVALSSDVIIVEPDGRIEPERKASNLNLNVRILLGDDIKVEAGEFRGALKGSLQVEQTPQLAPRGTGTIEIVNGDYVVYGQTLNIQRGRILFGGGPIDNPRLDMDVARRVEAYEVTAGARVRGTAQAPLLQLYSEPSMPDASILSFILLGQPPGTKGGSYTLGKYLTPDLYVSYGIGLFNAISTFNLRYKLTEKLALHATSGAASGADLIYTFER
ncbi:MAG: translocation/assembly module TamB domain-containing protein [Thiotrichales bacterium]